MGHEQGRVVALGESEGEGAAAKRHAPRRRDPVGGGGAGHVEVERRRRIDRDVALHGEDRLSAYLVDIASMEQRDDNVDELGRSILRERLGLLRRKAEELAMVIG